MTDRRGIYRVWVDWSNAADLAFAGTYDGVIGDVLSDPGLTIAGLGRDQARGLSPPQQPTLDVTLMNISGRYSAENASSPLAGSIIPGRLMRVSVYRGGAETWDDASASWDDPETWWDGATGSNLFTGALEDVEEDPGYGKQTVALHAAGRLGRLRSLYVATPLYQNITTGEAMGTLLAAAGLGTAEYWIDPDCIDNGRILSYWYVDGGDVMSAAITLWATEGYSASLEEDADGVIRFTGRNYRTLATRSQESQATYYDTDAGSLFHTGLRIRPGIRDVINYPYVESVIQREAATLGTMWSYNETLTLNSAGAGTVTARLNEPFVSATTPVVTTDFSLSVGTVAVSLSRTSGRSTDIVFAGGTPSAVVSDLALRGSLFVASGTIQATSLVDASSSQTTYGIRQYALDAWEGIAPTDAVSLCDGIVLAYQTPRTIVEIDVVSADWDHLESILDRQTGDRIHVVDAHSGVDLDLTIEQISHSIQAGRVHRVTFGCEKIVEADWALYDIDLYGVGVFGQ